MRLFTIHESEQLARNGLHENQNEDHIPVVKLFIPGSQCVWLLTETDSEYPNIAYGLCDLGLGEPYFDSFDLNEMVMPKFKLGYRIEKDLYFKSKYPLSVYAAAVEAHGCIVEQNIILQKFLPKN